MIGLDDNLRAFLSQSALFYLSNRIARCVSLFLTCPYLEENGNCKNYGSYRRCYLGKRCPLFQAHSLTNLLSFRSDFCFLHIVFNIQTK